ncbi:MAG: ribonuclease HII [Gammaproteobacteria bacterium]|nr:ribonuclease HII [Gammaproteobacteria bacterium]MCZ6577810.1 ribonuclease HII [Gammaproteobacteria bacterium]MCZ6724092.1 ribonuclease HII [Gammaproteobacteria bacterium]
MHDISKAKLVAGVDEAGRGPLAGSVVAAAVILDPSGFIEGLTDSKRLSTAKREKLEYQIRQEALAWAIGEASCTEIDEFNILQASLLAMKRAILRLDPEPQQVLIDGNRVPDISGFNLRAIVKGDLYEPCISAASILAKQYRDRQMQALDRLYPQYQFARHKGYPTRLHRDLLKQFGVSPIHRLSFKPVRELMRGSLDE